MKNIIASLILLSFVMTATALPVKRGQWRTLTLPDGTVVRAEMRGDEGTRWWQDAEGDCYVADTVGGQSVYMQADASTIADRAKSRMRRAATKLRARTKRLAAGNGDAFQGHKKGLIILAEFPNCRFTKGSQAVFDRIANEPGFSDYGFQGSVTDYFTEQSGGQFTLTFDVAGPVMMSHNYAYYGQNGEANAPEMIKEACRGVDSTVNFADYDWDGDGEVEEVFVVYAGHGQADYDSDNDNLIWPHQYWINATGSPWDVYMRDGVVVDVYACASELNGSGDLDGIGTFCHEFSHCMGLPDMYDTGKSGNFGMGSWDLMDYGCYSGNGYLPPGYSGYEKMVCGWTTPVELTEATDIAGVKPFSDMGQSYIVYNEGNRNEYYILENRQLKGFDRSLPGHGLLIEHIDYDETLWDYNVVNTTDNADAPNSHQRITIFHANNRTTDSGAAYPYRGNDSLTSGSMPAATVYNANTDGSHFMNRAIRNITESRDSTVSFSFAIEQRVPDVPEDGVIFRETFDKCDGAGGNDGRFSRISYGHTFSPDNSGWTGEYLNGGYKCAWFGNSRVPSGYVVSPAFTLTGDTATLSFRAAAWATDGTWMIVNVNEGNATILGDNEPTMKNGEWTTYTLQLVGSGSVKLEFIAAKRFFLDDVVVKTNATTSAIAQPRYAKSQARGLIYNLHGQPVGTAFTTLPHGVYIVGGRKVVK